MRSIAVLLLACAPVLFAQDNAHRQEAHFQNGGTVHLGLAVGDFHIAPGAPDHILVTWNGRTADKVQVKVDVSGSTATITTSNPHISNNDVHFDIQLPPNTSLTGDISVGNATVGPFTGNADLGLSVGNLEFTTADPHSFGDVSAATDIGNIDPGPFHASESGFLGKSIHWTGSGSQHLKLHVGTGNLQILQSR